MRDFEDRFSRGNGNFIIFTEASGMIEPGERTFNNPTPRKFFPLVGLDFLRNINRKSKLFGRGQ